MFGTGTGVAAPPWPPVRKKVRQPEAQRKTGHAEGAGALRRRAGGATFDKVFSFPSIPAPRARRKAAGAGGGAAKPHGLSEPVC